MILFFVNFEQILHLDLLFYCWLWTVKFRFGCFMNIWGVKLTTFHVKVNLSNKKQTPEVFYKKGFCKNFAKFTGKRLCQSLFFNKVAGLRPTTLLTETLAQMFSCEICKIFKNSFFTEHLRKLVQQMQHYKIAALNTTTNSNIFSAFLFL